MKLTMKSWKKGLKTVSLVEAVKAHSTGSLIRAKADVDRLLDGGEVTLEFSSESVMNEFKRVAEGLGVVFE